MPSPRHEEKEVKIHVSGRLSWHNEKFGLALTFSGSVQLGGMANVGKVITIEGVSIASHTLRAMGAEDRTRCGATDWRM